MSDVALERALKTSVRGRKPGEAGKNRKRVHKASFASAQRKIKKDLKIDHTIEGDALVSAGRCLDEASNSVVGRWVQFGSSARADKGDKGRRLTGPIALSGLLSLVPVDQRGSVTIYVNEALDAFYDV